jgi:hypothetical protein
MINYAKACDDVENRDPFIDVSSCVARAMTRDERGLEREMALKALVAYATKQNRTIST